MQNQIKIAAIQSEIIWENPIENLKHYDEMISGISSDIDLIVLPEMFATGFTMNPENCAETMDGVSVNWMQKKRKN